MTPSTSGRDCGDAVLLSNPWAGASLPRIPAAKRLGSDHWAGYTPLSSLLRADAEEFVSEVSI